MSQLQLLQQQRAARQQQMLLSTVQASASRRELTGGARRPRFGEGGDVLKRTRARFHEEDAQVAALPLQVAATETSAQLLCVPRPHVLPADHFVGVFEQASNI